MQNQPIEEKVPVRINRKFPIKGNTKFATYLMDSLNAREESLERWFNENRKIVYSRHNGKLIKY